MHMIYYYLVTNYNNPSALTESVWCVRVLCQQRNGSHRYPGTGAGMYVRLWEVGFGLR